MIDEAAKILIVDDETNLLRSVAKTLLRAGYTVETAENNATALQIVQAAQTQQPFDLIILDLNLPDFSGRESRYAGLELLDRLKVETPRTPVMINSAWDEVETAKRCIDRGAVDYFVKGRTGEMLAKIRAVLEK
ncbi:MAG: response regulator [Anaerolineae bacterium]|nr:response regulator [Anaerolineae bacterium]